MKLHTISTLLVLCGAAHAQTTIYGVDPRLDGFFTSDTGSFVANLTVLGPHTGSVFALDFDETATTLWGVDNSSLDYGTFALSDGTFTPMGSLAGTVVGATGLTCAADGTWFLSEFASPDSNLYVGDVTTGTFAFVGVISPGIMIDISIDSQGNLYGHNISDDSLYSIDTTTGAGTLIGPTGQAANFAQGMDFDWTDDTLYATIYTGGGTGVFADFNLSTGFANVIESTTSTNREMEIACQAVPSDLGTSYCMSAVNSTGGEALISASGSAVVADNDLTLTAEPVPNEPGIFFLGTAAVNAIPFGDGFRCVGGTTIRLSPNVGTNNVLTRMVDLVGPPISGQVTAGSTWFFQAWYRDPAAMMNGFNLSDGLEILFQ